GLAPLEANACGLPVIAVAEGGVRETIVDGRNGLLVESDAKTMATAIERIMTDTDYARELGIMGSKMVGERWSLKASIDRLEQRFYEIVG
ncbi:MAG: glycosyltransferase family 4 protein, partial [Nitrospirae bacterium]|nr:glycosyltransferase family 4 protein [Nitrospirota bacterium]